MRPIEVRFEKNINNITLVREADTRRQSEYIAVAILGAVFVIGLLVYGAQLYQYQQYGYQITQAQARKVVLENTRDSLRLFRDQLQDPDRISQIAKRMGMVPAEPAQLVNVTRESLNTSNPQLAAKK